MAILRPVQKPSITTQAYASPPQKYSSMASTKEDHHQYHLNFICPFSIPSTPETAAIRIIKNLVSFGSCYLHFMYIVLFIALIPKRKVSLVYLVGMREIASLYLLLLSALPKSFLLNKSPCKSFVWFLLFIISAVFLILTKAGIHLLITLVSTVPVILVHATLWKEDLNFVTGEEDSADAKETVPFIFGDDGDE